MWYRSETPDYRINKCSIGYTVNKWDDMNIGYSADAVLQQDNDNSDICLSTITENKGNVEIVSFNGMGVVSKYGYDITGASYKKPKKVIAAQSHGFDYKSLSATYSDTLDVFHDDFENDCCDWSCEDSTSEIAIEGERSIFGNELSKTYSLTSDNMENNTTLYLSLWALKGVNGSDFCITIHIKEGGSEQQIVMQHKLDAKLSEKWQFTALCLGKRKIGDEITVGISCGNSGVVYIDDVHLTKMPYETPDDIANTYDSFGNISTSYRYNPVDDAIETTTYEYNSEHQLLQQKTLKNDNTQKNKVVNTYDKGLLTSEKEYGLSNTLYKKQQNIYNDNYILKTLIDENNIVTKYTYGKDTSETVVVGEENSPSMQQKEERFPNSDMIKTLYLENLQNGYDYLTNGNLHNTKFNYTAPDYNAEILFEYDTYNNLKAIKIGDVALATMIYDYKHLNEITYANDYKLSYKYDTKDRITAASENNKDTYSIEYSDNAEDLITVSHSDGLTYTSKQVNKRGITGENAVRFSDEKDILKVVGYAANRTGNITTVGYFIDDGETPFEKCVTTTDGNGCLIKTERSYHGANNVYDYDDMYRLNSKTTTYNSANGAKNYKTTYSYNVLGANCEGSLITSEKHYNGSASEEYGYEYYSNGNIKKILLDSKVRNEYFYDRYGRLIREDNYELFRSYRFVYDNGGNITKKETYFITNGNVETSPVVTDNYDYTTITSGCGQNAAWKDQLKRYNNRTITYDALGNPLNYLGKVMTWCGRKATSIDGIALDYDYNDLRVKKGAKTYYWNNKNLILETWVKDGTHHRIYYYYDESGVCGMNYNGSEYYFRKNIFGDIIAIYDNFGNLQCRYVYDAWGNHKVFNAYGVEIGTDVINIGNINPIRYRGYYWDSEFNLYYLQSRYYDPALGRFISSDDVGYLEPKSVVGLNLYAYCGNNPIAYVDPEGKSLTLLLIGFLVGALVGGVTSLINEVSEKGWENVNVGKVIVDSLIGGVGGMLTATGLTAIEMGLVGAGLGFAQGAFDSMFDGKSFSDYNTWIDIGISTIVGGLSFYFSGAGAKDAAGIAGDLSKQIFGQKTNNKFLQMMIGKTIQVETATIKAIITKRLVKGILKAGILPMINVLISAIEEWFDI